MDIPQLFENKEAKLLFWVEGKINSKVIWLILISSLFIDVESKKAT